MAYDLIIKNGLVIDGSGKKEPFKADIAVTKGVISGIGFLGNADATTKIDAHGKYVTPGFIDVLNHSDTYLTLFDTPGQDSLVSQGVTTIIGGNCGYSLAPLVTGGSFDSVERWTSTSQVNIDWLRMSEYLQKLRERPFALNFGTLTGYNTLISGVLKGEYRQPSSQENEIASFLLDQSLQEGSFGLSMGLAYLYQDKHFADHLESVFATIKKYKKTVTVHLRDESNQFLDSLAAMLAHAGEYGVKLHVSHMKVIGRPFWGNFRKAITLIEEAKEKGAFVSFDMFPYASSGLALYLLLPAWVKVGGPEMIMKRLRSSFDRAQIVKDLKAQELEYDKMTIASRAPNPVFIGKTVEDVARTLGVSGEEALVELMLGSGLQVIVFAHVLDEANVEMGIAHPLSLIASSGAGYNAQKASMQSDLPHPRSFGTFPRFLKKYVRDKHLLSWEEAIAKITSMPAELLGIEKRGYVKEGFQADLAIVDPQEVGDVATFLNPYRYSTGIVHTIVNGVSAYANGKPSPLLSGRVLTPTR